MNSVCVSILPSSISSIDGAGGRLIDEKTFSLVIPEYTKKKKRRVGPISFLLFSDYYKSENKTI
jgi:hypothetical protein